MIKNYHKIITEEIKRYLESKTKKELMYLTIGNAAKEMNTTMVTFKKYLACVDNPAELQILELESQEKVKPIN